MPEQTEAFSRVLIDQALRDSGWDQLDQRQVRFELRGTSGRADYVLANPPFNDSDWRGELLKHYRRWAYGVPPAGNANYAWLQHFIHHLAPTGLAGFILAMNTGTEDA